MLYIWSFSPGGPSARALPLLPAVVFQERTSLPGHLYPRRHAGNERVRGTRRHQRLHDHPLDGHEVRTRGQEVSK